MLQFARHVPVEATVALASRSSPVATAREHEVQAWMPDAAASWRDALRSLRHDPDATLALTVSLPFCAAHCLCCERPIRAARPADEIERHVDGLLQELHTLRARIGAAPELVALHLGGGGVGELGASALLRLVQAIDAAWHRPRDAETSFDCDPRRASARHFDLLHALGFETVRFGVPDLTPEVQQAIGRHHSVALIADACETARDSGLRRVAFELMVGLPAQTPGGWQRTLERAIGLAPDRILLRRYRHRPALFAGQRGFDPDQLPSPLRVQAMLAAAASELRGCGYREVGGDTFVLDDDPLACAADSGSLRRGTAGWSATAARAELALGVGGLTELAGRQFRHPASHAAWAAAVAAGLPPAAAEPEADTAPALGRPGGAVAVALGVGA